MPLIASTKLKPVSNPEVGKRECILMNDKSGDTSENINALANLAKAVPIYDDALKPVAVETGKALGTLGRAVNAAMAPIRGFVWGAEQVENWINDRVARKLHGTSAEEIETPDLAIAGPTIDALRFNGHKPELSEMFASLLASAMSKRTSAKTHPIYVEFIKSLSSLDAQVFAALSSGASYPAADVASTKEGEAGESPHLMHYCPHVLNEVSKYTTVHPHQLQASVENLARMKLVDAVSHRHLTSNIHTSTYKSIPSDPRLSELVKFIESMHRKPIFHNGHIRCTQLGRDFAAVCL